jgi:Sigma-70 region 2
VVSPNELSRCSDEELLVLGAQDAQAFGALYDRYEDPLLAFFRRATGHADLAADLTAEVFAVALASVGSFRPELGSARGWLFGIARHELAQSWRRGRVDAEARRRLGMEPISTPGQLLKGVGTGGVVPVAGPITEVHYRDGATCHLTSRSWIGGAYACTPGMQVPVGYVAPQNLSYTHPQVAAPLGVRLIRTHHDRYELRLTRKSRVALTNAESGYDFAWYIPGTLHENHGDYRTESDIAAGQTVSTTTCPLPPGIVRGTVSLYEPDEVFKNKSEVVYAYKYEKTGILVASFSVRIPGAPHPTNPEAERPSPFASCSARVPRPHLGIPVTRPASSRSKTR